MKKLIFFSLMLLYSDVFSQQTSLSDIFPLAVDSCWIYSFRTVYGYPAIQQSTEDEGYIYYKIVISVAYSDSTEWLFSAKRDFIRTIAPPGHLPPVVEEHHDTLYFSIIEKLEGNHQLHLLWALIPLLNYVHPSNSFVIFELVQNPSSLLLYLSHHNVCLSHSQYLPYR